MNFDMKYMTDSLGIPENGKWMFRYINISYGSDNVYLCCEIYKVVSKTPRGCWIMPKGVDDLKLKRFVRDVGRKRFAYLTRKEAMESFKCRKAAQIRILERQLGMARKAYEIASEK